MRPGNRGSFIGQSDDPQLGMQPDEIIRWIAQARNAGFTILGRTRVGFRGQILSMTFYQPKTEGE